MKIAIDTNVLVRYITWDDERQGRKAQRVIEQADVIAISMIVLCELVWVLRRAYRYSGEEVANVIVGLTQSRNVQVDLAAAEAGLRMLARGSDFADGVIEHEALRSGCAGFATFDETFGRLLDPALRRA